MALLALLGGCYTYGPVQARAVAPRQDVTVWVNEAGMAAITPVIGPRAAELQGIVTARSDSSLTLALRSVTRRGGMEETMANDLVTVGLGSMDSVRLRRFDRTRTLLMAGGVVVGAILVRVVSNESGFERATGGKAGGAQ